MIKYYKNLIKRKKYGPIFRGLFFVLIGILVFFISISEIKNGNIATDVNRAYTGELIVDMLASTNVGMIAIAAITIYLGLIFIPLNSPDAQDESDYEVRLEGENIYIKFKNNEFLVKREIFSPTKLFYKDKNGHFVTMTRGYQIYNYINSKYINSVEKMSENYQVISKTEVVDKFSNVRKMTNEEKNEFFKVKKLKDRVRPFFIITSVMLWGIFSFFALGLVSMIIMNDFPDTSTIIFIIMCIGISYILGRISNKAIFKNKKIIKRIMYSDMYIVECEIFDKKITDNDNGNNYYVRIKDGNYLVDQWIEIPEKKYPKDGNSKVEFYVFDKTGSKFFDIK